MRVVTFKADDLLLDIIEELKDKLGLNKSEVIRLALKKLWVEVSNGGWNGGSVGGGEIIYKVIEVF